MMVKITIVKCKIHFIKIDKIKTRKYYIYDCMIHLFILNPKPIFKKLLNIFLYFSLNFLF